MCQLKNIDIMMAIKNDKQHLERARTESKRKVRSKAQRQMPVDGEYRHRGNTVANTDILWATRWCGPRDPFEHCGQSFLL